MAIERKPHWQSQMHDFLVARAPMAFAWGANDCALFVCDAVETLTGTDIGAAFRGKYSDMRGALSVSKEVTGSATLEDVATWIGTQFAMPELTTVKLAQRGDVVLFDGEEGPALGVVDLNGYEATFVGLEGLRRIGVHLCRRAWRVG